MNMTEVRKELIDGLSNGRDFLQVTHEAYSDNWNNDAPVIEAIASIHNEGIINILSEFRKLRNNDDDRQDFFIMHLLFQKALPILNAPVDSIMDCVLHLTGEEGRIYLLIIVQLIKNGQLML